MSIKHVKGDILTTPTRNEDTVICHQVNCCGVMGAGLAKQIRDKWPVVFDEYKKICGTDRLGDSQTVQVAPQLYVANLFGRTEHMAEISARRTTRRWQRLFWGNESTS